MRTVKYKAIRPGSGTVVYMDYGESDRDIRAYFGANAEIQQGYIVLYDSIEDFRQNDLETRKRRALAKLDDSDLEVLGLKR